MDNERKIIGVKRGHLLVFVVILILILGAALYFFNQARSLKNEPNKAVEKEIADIVADVSKHILLPEGETPTLATVSDLSPLKGQPFFAKAEVGDKVLLYTTAKKAYLWRPSLEKIIEASPLNIDTTGTPGAGGSL